ncbi:MAG: hypothetical protein K2K85_04170 [Clostridia bacterium]|nr:hypothetical protein [Clostridia bacterium]
MKKKILTSILVLIIVLSIAFAFAGCNAKLDAQEAWQTFADALAESKNYTQGKDYYIKYRYKEGDVTITQKLNVAYGNSYIDGWDDFVIADRGVEKASKIKTDYYNSYFGYSLRSGVKAKKADKEDYKLGYIADNTFIEGMQAEEFFNLKAGDTLNGKILTADEEVCKYTLAYALSTLDGIDSESAKIVSAVKNGAVTTLQIVVEDESLYYGKYNADSKCLIVQITVGRITKISCADANEPVFFINYAGPKFSLPNYDGEKITQV